MLKRGCMNRRNRAWTRRGETIAELTLVADIDCHERYPCLKMTSHAFGQKIDHLVMLDSVPMPFGGERWYALCPFTRGIRCSTLVLPPGKLYFASVKGWKVPYAARCIAPIARSTRPPAACRSYRSIPGGQPGKRFGKELQRGRRSLIRR